MMRRKIYLMVVVTVASMCTFAQPKGRQSVNRVHPPRNTEQYRKEADRAHLEKLTSVLGLTEAQQVKFSKENSNRQKKENKQAEKLNKERQRWEKAQMEDSVAHENLIRDYHANLQKILTPQQYQSYLEWLRANALPSCESETDVAKPGPGPLVKGPDPVLLTK